MGAPRSMTGAWLMGGILAVAAVLRAWNLGFGLPAVYNPDEVAIMNRAVALGQNGLNPHNFLYPSLYFYVLFAWEGAWFLAGRAAGLFGSLADFERAYFVDPSSIFLAGRALSVVLGTATVWVTGRLAGRLFGRHAAYVAATLLAVAPLAVRDAHYVKHDVPVTLPIIAALAAAAAAVDTRRMRTWLGAGALAGLAMSTHYYAVFVILPIVAAAAIATDRGHRLRVTVSIVAVAATVFALTSPFVLLDFETTLRDLQGNRQIVIDRATDMGGAFASFAYYVTWLASDAVGPGTMLLALAGVVVAARAGAVRAVMLLLFPIIFLGFIANTVPASRYLNPVLPFIAILAGGATAWVIGRTRLTWLGIALTLVAVQGSAATAIEVNRFFGQTDTRTLAETWIHGHVPAESTVLVQPYSVPLRQARIALEEALAHHLGDARRASVKFRRQLALDPYPAPAYRLIFLGAGGLDVDRIYIDPASLTAPDPLEPLRRHAVTYVVLKRYNEPDPSLVVLTRALGERARRVATFSPYRSDADIQSQAATPPFLHNTDARVGAALDRPGPIVDVWSLN